MKSSLLNSCRSGALSRAVVVLICFIMIAGQVAAQTFTVKSGLQKQDGDLTQTAFMNWTGAYSCQAVNASPDPSLAHVTTDNELSLNYTPPTASTTVTYTANANPNRYLVGPNDPFNSITTSRSTNTLSWSSTKAISAIIVGASGAPGRIYLYPQGVFNDTGLQNPGNSNISNVTFCYYGAAEISIVKQVQVFGGTASTTSFPFTATNLGPSSFSLVDNDVAGPDRYDSAPLYVFSKVGNDVVVTEGLVNTWTLSDITCVDTDYEPGQPQFSNIVDFANRTVTIRLEESEGVVCTFTNTALVPTAAQVEISGRVTRSDGNGIPRAQLTLFNASTLQSKTVITNPFGYYRIDRVDVGDFYILTVKHKTYSFPNGQRSFTVDDALPNVDFVSSQ